MMVPREAARVVIAVVNILTARYWAQAPDRVLVVVVVTHVMYQVQKELHVVEIFSRTETPVLVLQGVGSDEQRIMQIHQTTKILLCIRISKEQMEYVLQLGSHVALAVPPDPEVLLVVVVVLVTANAAVVMGAVEIVYVQIRENVQTLDRFLANHQITQEIVATLMVCVVSKQTTLPHV
jgi:hypothetical protein